MFWLAWGPGIAVMSPCTPAHPPPMGALRPPRNLHFSFSDSPEPSTLLTGWGKSSLNRGETAMERDEFTPLFICRGTLCQLCQRSLYLSFKHRQQEKSAESALSCADKISTLLRVSSTFLAPQNTTQILQKQVFPAPYFSNVFSDLICF